MTSYLDNLVGFRSCFQWIPREDLPVVENALRESLSSGVTSQVSGETKWFVDRQMRLDNEHRSTSNLQDVNFVGLVLYYTIL